MDPAVAVARLDCGSGDLPQDVAVVGEAGFISLAPILADLAQDMEKMEKGLRKLMALR